ncbi:MAG: NAD(P)H-hydrate dehydratase [Betaproteobacteria bacterium]
MTLAEHREMKNRRTANAIAIDEALLRQWPLPMPFSDDDKEGRGHILVVAGSREMPGAAVLAATAALRAGAGKLVIATDVGAAQSVALAIPESRVIALRKTRKGGIAEDGVEELGDLCKSVDAVVLGPGMQEETALCEFVVALMSRVDHAKFLLDASAMDVMRAADAGAKPAHGSIERFAKPAILTPHAGEMAHLTGLTKQTIDNDPRKAATDAAGQWNAVIVLKGPCSYIAPPDGRLWKHDGGNVGLATSGSGDTLAGIIGGLLARGAALEQAAAWGVALHALAGEQLVEKFGPLGFLARELLPEIAPLLHSLRPRR